MHRLSADTGARGGASALQISLDMPQPRPRLRDGRDGTTSGCPATTRKRHHGRGDRVAVTGIGTVAMMAVAARALPASEYAGFAVWWTVATLMGTSFGVFEVYLARLVAAARAGGGDPER